MKDYKKESHDVMARTSAKLYDSASMLRQAINSVWQASVDIARVDQRLQDLDVREVGHSGPVTYVVFNDGTITRTRCQDNDEYDAEKGLLYCLVKRMYPNWHDIMTKHLWDSHE